MPVSSTKVPKPRRPLSTMNSFLKRAASSFTSPLSSQTSVPKRSSGSDFLVAPNEKTLFPVVDPAIDGDDCERDCETCTIHYPAKFSIDEEDNLYGHIKGWSTHLLVGTGKTDWVRDVEDEKGSVMEAVGKANKPTNGKLMLSASNIPVPEHGDGSHTTVLLLPSFTVIEQISPSDVPTLINSVISHAPTNTSRIESSSPNDLPIIPDTAAIDPSLPPAATAPAPPPIPFPNHPSPHIAVILVCSQKTRDARCGQSAPLLRREFERHLRPLGLYRDLHDQRPGGVGIYFISHVGGHKYSANVMIYRRGGDAFEKFQTTDTNGTNGTNGTSSNGVKETKTEDVGASQCLWLARVKPEDCEGIVKYTVLQGKIRKPESQLRGGFDRERGLCSW